MKTQSVIQIIGTIVTITRIEIKVTHVRTKLPKKMHPYQKIHLYKNINMCPKSTFKQNQPNVVPENPAAPGQMFEP